MYKVVVTGATGFLGKHIVNELIKCGKYSVVGVSRKENKVVAEGYRYIHRDIVKDNLEEVMHGADIVVHAAALSTCWGEWMDFYNNNVIGTKNVLQAACKCGVKKFIFISSPSVYENVSNRIDVKESSISLEDNVGIGEYNNLYAYSKLLCEKEVYKYQKEYMDCIILRPRALIGCGDVSIVPRIIKVYNKIGIPLVDKGENIIDVTCVENVVHAIKISIEALKSENKSRDIRGNWNWVFNITNDNHMKFKELTDELLIGLNLSPKYVNISRNSINMLARCNEKVCKMCKIKKEPSLTKYTVSVLSDPCTLDITKAKNILGYRPIKSIQDGIKSYSLKVESV